ncbi:MAG: T9SS type A sorting domain-containing protein [Prolixibacteraceae bacterium]|nr:T9SS type A sorting domain-containing protein [Prolixibacteraceae bacterium]
MKKLQLLFFASVLIFQVAQGQKISPQNITVCYGSQASLNLTEYYTDDIITWQYAYDINGTFVELTNQNKSTLVMETSLFQKKIIYVQALLNGIKKSNKAVISFYTDVDFNVNVDPVCLSSLNTLSASSTQKLTYKWYINENLIGEGADVNYYPTTSGVYKLKINGQNEFGCTNTLLKDITVVSPPEVNIELSEVICGNGIDLVTLKVNGNEKIQSKGFTIWDGESLYTKYSTVPNGDSYSIKWLETKTEKQLTLKMEYKTINGCTYFKSKEFLLLHELVPEAGKVFRKAKNSNLLIYHPAVKGEMLDYVWGYTDSSGKDVILKVANRSYALYENINPVNKYWVEISLPSSSFCKSRVVYSLENDSKYQLSLQTRLFPNPASKTLNIEVPEDLGKITVSVFRLDGILVRTIQFDNPTGLIQMDIQDLKNGLYNIGISANNGEEYSKTILINNLF